MVMVGLISGVSSLSAQIWKWEQLPDLSTNGIDILATFNTGSTPATAKVLLADQFVCGLSGPITGIHFWGSWLDNNFDPNVKFSISILANNVTGTGGIGFERPGRVLWTSLLAPTTWGVYNPQIPTAQQQQMFWNPSTPGAIGQAAVNLTLQYDFVNPMSSFGQLFNQASGTTYWLSIQASTSSGQLFGWSTRDLMEGHTGVAAVYGTNTVLGSTRIGFNDMGYPDGMVPAGQPIDLAFSIETPEPTATAVIAMGLAALLWRRKTAG